MILPRKKTSGSLTLDHNSFLQKEQSKKKQSTATLPHSFYPSSTSSLKQSQLRKVQQNSSSSASEDDAYILLHPSGASASMLYTGDSGFEDVRPLQRLDQEVIDNGGSCESESKSHIIPNK